MPRDAQGRITRWVLVAVAIAGLLAFAGLSFADEDTAIAEALAVRK